MSGFKSGLNPDDVAQECRKLGIKSIFTDKVPPLPPLPPSPPSPHCPRQEDLPCLPSCYNYADCYLLSANYRVGKGG